MERQDISSVSRREMLKTLGLGIAALAASPLTSWAAETAARNGPAFSLPPLPYAFNALEPHIDARTMEIHHDKHHAAYVEKLNAALESYPKLRTLSVMTIISDLKNVPEKIRAAVRNNGGGHANHVMFWGSLTPGGSGPPSGKVGEKINEVFGGFEWFN